MSHLLLLRKYDHEFRGPRTGKVPEGKPAAKFLPDGALLNSNPGKRSNGSEGIPLFPGIRPPVLTSSQFAGIVQGKYSPEHSASPTHFHFLLPALNRDPLAYRPGDEPTQMAGAKFPGRASFSFLRRTHGIVPAILDFPCGLYF